MEDFQDAKIAKIGDRMVGLFGVFDGESYWFFSKTAPFICCELCSTHVNILALQVTEVHAPRNM